MLVVYSFNHVQSLKVDYTVRDVSLEVNYMTSGLWYLDRKIEVFLPWALIMKCVFRLYIWILPWWYVKSKEKDHPQVYRFFLKSEFIIMGADIFLYLEGILFLWWNQWGASLSVKYEPTGSSLYVLFWGLPAGQRSSFLFYFTFNNTMINSNRVLLNFSSIVIT